MSEQKTKTIREWTYYFVSGQSVTVALEPDESIDQADSCMVVRQKHRTTTVYDRNLLWSEYREYQVRVNEPAPARG